MRPQHRMNKGYPPMVEFMCVLACRSAARLRLQLCGPGPLILVNVPLFEAGDAR